MIEVGKEEIVIHQLIGFDSISWSIQNLRQINGYFCNINRIIKSVKRIISDKNSNIIQKPLGKPGIPNQNRAVTALKILHKKIKKLHFIWKELVLCPYSFIKSPISGFKIVSCVMGCFSSHEFLSISLPSLSSALVKDF